jgi:hypothetical protein
VKFEGINLATKREALAYRAIAEEIGVSHPTVAKARRQSTGNSLPVDDEPRIGLDGKVRRMPTRFCWKPRARRPAGSRWRA